MKNKLLFLTLMAMIGLSASAQPRVAVLDFNAGVHVSQNDVDGLSAIFNTYFEPAGYTVVERTRVSRILEEQNMQGGRLTEKEMVKLSEILNVPVIVIGDVNKAMGQYNIDVRTVNVETGAILAKDGAEWAEGTSYRTMMRALAERLSKSIPLVEFHRQPVVATPPTPKPAQRRYYPEGGSLRLTGGVWIFSVAYNHQVTPSFMIGGGAGVSTIREVETSGYSGWTSIHQKGAGLPLFFETELRTPRYEWSLFLNAKIGYLIHGSENNYGYNTYTYPHFFSQVTGGISYKHLNLGIGWSYTPFDDIPITINLSYNLPFELLRKWFY